MQIEVDTTFEQFFEVSRLLCLKTTRWRRWNYLCLWYGFPVLGAAFVLLALFFTYERDVAAALFNFAGALFFFWCRFGARRRLRTVYKKQRRNFPGTITLTSTGLHFEAKDSTTQAHYTWQAFERWIENDDMYLVLPNLMSFIRIPKETLTGAEQDQVRVWLAAGVKPLS